MSALAPRPAEAPAAAPAPARRTPVVWQPRHPVFWLASAMVVLFGVQIAQTLFTDRSAAPMAIVVSFGFLVAEGALLWAILRTMPRFRRQPLSLLLAALIWGATAAPGAAMIPNTDMGDVLARFGLNSMAAALTAPLNEDVMRLLGVLVVLVLGWGRRITVMDGAVYGFLVGTGFTLAENLLYALRGSDPAAAAGVSLLRILVGFGNHALWTTVAGAALAYCLARRQRGQGGRWGVLAIGLLVPMALHILWDMPALTVISLLHFLLLLVFLYVPTVVLFLLAVAAGRRDEFAWFTETTGSALTRKEFRRLPRAERRGLADDAVAAERLLPRG